MVAILFTVDKVHIALMKKANVKWNGAGYDGAPCLDMKRPYGNSDVLSDIQKVYSKAKDLEILRLRDGGSIIVDGDRIVSKDSETESPSTDLLMKYHTDMETVFQILAENCEQGISEGSYTRESSYSGSWKKLN